MLPLAHAQTNYLGLFLHVWLVDSETRIGVDESSESKGSDNYVIERMV
jgi:hypothetical protein